MRQARHLEMETLGVICGQQNCLLRKHHVYYGGLVPVSSGFFYSVWDVQVAKLLWLTACQGAAGFFEGSCMYGRDRPFERDCCS